jgi:hypothetical protein
VTARYVVIVTGSRDLDKDTGRALVYRDLDSLHATTAAAGQQLVVRHGAHISGADLYAADWCTLHPDVVENRHPADWGGPCRRTCKPGHRRPAANGHTRCPAAGPYRNRAMVDLGADEICAYPLPGSRGTRDCIDHARRAGIPVSIPPELLTLAEAHRV